MRINYLIAPLCLVLAACHNQTAVETQSRTTEMTESQSYTNDTIPIFDTLALITPLNEDVQFKLFKSVLKGTKTKKLYDFSALGNDRLLDTYRNFHQTFTHYIDSSDQRYTDFFNTFYEQLELHEQDLAETDTLEIRTKLEIARLKSDIRAGFALKKAEKLQP